MKASLQEKIFSIVETPRLESKGNAKQRISQKLFRFSTTTTSHGLPRIVESKKLYQRIIWTVFLLSSVCVCAYSIAQSIIEYLKFEVITQIRVVPHSEIVFPQVSICNLNPYIAPQATQYLYASSDPSFAAYLLKNPESNKTLKQSMAFSFDDILLSCQFRFNDCNSSYFQWYFHPYYGNCYYFNSISQSSQLKTVGRERDGLQVDLFVGPSDLYLRYLAIESLGYIFFSNLRLMIASLLLYLQS